MPVKCIFVNFNSAYYTNNQKVNVNQRKQANNCSYPLNDNVHCTLETHFRIFILNV